jgi:hypothetical protein
MEDGGRVAVVEEVARSNTEASRGAAAWSTAASYRPTSDPPLQAPHPNTDSILASIFLKFFYHFVHRLKIGASSNYFASSCRWHQRDDEADSKLAAPAHTVQKIWCLFFFM